MTLVAANRAVMIETLDVQNHAIEMMKAVATIDVSLALDVMIVPNDATTIVMIDDATSVPNDVTTIDDAIIVPINAQNVDQIDGTKSDLTDVPMNVHLPAAKNAHVPSHHVSRNSETIDAADLQATLIAASAEAIDAKSKLLVRTSEIVVMIGQYHEAKTNHLQHRDVNRVHAKKIVTKNPSTAPLVKSELPFEVDLHVDAIESPKKKLNLRLQPIFKAPPNGVV
jgi:hypothetical protein